MLGDGDHQRPDYGQQALSNWSINDDCHFGGFARRNLVLDQFIEKFRAQHGIDLEWVYVAKMMYGIFDLIEKEKFASGRTAIAVITG